MSSYFEGLSLITVMFCLNAAGQKNHNAVNNIVQETDGPCFWHIIGGTNKLDLQKVGVIISRAQRALIRERASSSAYDEKTLVLYKKCYVDTGPKKKKEKRKKASEEAQ